MLSNSLFGGFVTSLRNEPERKKKGRKKVEPKRIEKIHQEVFFVDLGSFFFWKGLALIPRPLPPISNLKEGERAGPFLKSCP
jgi:hypothetical protein